MASGSPSDPDIPTGVCIPTGITTTADHITRIASIAEMTVRITFIETAIATIVCTGGMMTTIGKDFQHEFRACRIPRQAFLLLRGGPDPAYSPSHVDPRQTYLDRGL